MKSLSFWCLAILLFPLGRAGAEAPACSRCAAVYGDSRDGHEAHRRIVARILALKPALVFHSGDMVHDGRSDEAWKSFDEITAGLRRSAEFFPVHGNHENHAPRFFAEFQLDPKKPWYSVDRFGVHFAVLDSESPFWKGTSQGTWLEKDLKAASAREDVRHIVVLLHRPIYGTGHHGPDDSKVLAPALTPWFKKYGVGAVFSGHDHLYERSQVDGITYVVAGGGGAPLYTEQEQPAATNQVFKSTYNFVALSVTPEGLLCEAFDDAGKPLDSFTVRARAVPAGGR